MRKLEKMMNNPVVQMLNAKYGIGLDYAYKIYVTYGDSKTAHEFAEWIMKQKKDGNVLSEDFDDVCLSFSLDNK